MQKPNRGRGIRCAGFTIAALPCFNGAAASPWQARRCCRYVEMAIRYMRVMVPGSLRSTQFMWQSRTTAFHRRDGESAVISASPGLQYIAVRRLSTTRTGDSIDKRSDFVEIRVHQMARAEEVPSGVFPEILLFYIRNPAEVSVFVLR